MRETEAIAGGMFAVVTDLRGGFLVAAVYGPNAWGTITLRLNGRLVSAPNRPRVVRWARREVAAGRRVAWLTVDDLAGLA